MGEAEAGQVLPAVGEVGQGVDHADEPVADQSERLADQDQVGVVGDVAARRAEVDDRPGARGRRRRRRGRGPSRRAGAASRARGGLEVDVVDLGAQSSAICASVIGRPESRLGLGQRDPEPPPGGELPLRRPELGHLPAGVAGDRADSRRVRVGSWEWSMGRDRSGDDDGVDSERVRDCRSDEGSIAGIGSDPPQDAGPADAGDGEHEGGGPHRE